MEQGSTTDPDLESTLDAVLGRVPGGPALTVRDPTPASMRSDALTAFTELDLAYVDRNVDRSVCRSWLVVWA